MSAYKLYNNVPCITAEQFQQLFSLETYRNGLRRDYFTKRGRGGNGREVLIEVPTIRRIDFKARILEKMGPVEEAKHANYLLAVEPDDDARKFYKEYVYMLGDKKTTLPEDAQQQYCNEAAIFNMLDRVMKMQIKARQSGKKLKMNIFWQDAINAIHSKTITTDYPHNLPANARFLERKFKSYIDNGYESLITNKYGNRNTERLCDDAKMWVLAAWANQVEKATDLIHLLSLYNEKAATMPKWKTIKSEQTLHNFLYEPEIQKLWHGHRYGELKSKEKFTLFNSTKMPVLRDTLWYSDGTKLNYFYQCVEDGKVKIKTTSVYEVMDVSSEFLLGFHISDSENFEQQYRAYKMAMQTAGHKPYEISYDNQGGHKKLETSDFLNRLAHLCIRTKPYNGKSKTIESAFGRLQMEFLKRDWFFSGQNIQSKKAESKANMDFILDNKHNLPTLDEIKKIYEKRRHEWNNAPHPKSGKSRCDTYYSTANEQSPALRIEDYVDMFWITRRDEVTYTADGLKFTEAKNEYKYIKYSEPLQPDFDFHFDNIGKKFVVRFDPEDTSMIFVYEKDATGRLRFVTEMTTKIETHRAKQEQEYWEAEYLQHIDAKNTEKRSDVWNEMENILRQQGMDAESYGLNPSGLRGIKTEKKPVKIKTQPDWNKALSNAVPVAVYGNDDFDNDTDIYNLM